MAKSGKSEVNYEIKGLFFDTLELMEAHVPIKTGQADESLA